VKHQRSAGQVSTGSCHVIDRLTTGTLWSSIYDGAYFSANVWKTIDKGLSRLSEAFHPIVDGKITYERRVERLSFNETTNKTGVHWKGGMSEFDKTLVAVPFSVVKLWRRPSLNPVMTEAITGLGYAYACKIAVSSFGNACEKS